MKPLTKISDGVWAGAEKNYFAVTVFPYGSFWGKDLLLSSDKNIYVGVAELPELLTKLFQECDRKLTPAILEKISKEYKSYLVKVML